MFLILRMIVLKLRQLEYIKCYRHASSNQALDDLLKCLDYEHNMIHTRYASTKVYQFNALSILLSFYQFLEKQVVSFLNDEKISVKEQWKTNYILEILNLTYPN